MPDLIAQGPANEDRWRRELPDAASGIDILIGRNGADWDVPWDGMISRSHVRLTPLGDDRVEVTCLTTARNSVFHRGKRATQFTLVPGDHFVIGNTTFSLATRPGTSEVSTDGAITEHAYDHALLQRHRFRDSSGRIEMLSRLPDLIMSSGSDEELLVRVARVLLQATPEATAVAIVAGAADFHVGPGKPARSDLNRPPASDSVRILHYDSRAAAGRGQEPAVSASLVRSAIHKRESLLHLWAGHQEDAAFTASEDVDWAFCVPLRTEACRGWALYVTGQIQTLAGQAIDQSLQLAPEHLQDDVKFAELVGTTIANLYQSRRLERRQAAMRHFFAPVVLDALAGRDTNEVLEPRVADLSVMFCDLRGFSRRSERDAEHLLELLAAVSGALGVMTRHILDTGGVIGDFHGDAAMGFWGWPLEQGDHALRAADTAMNICKDYRSEGGETFRCGIGIATGRAVAGRIGTIDQVKVTAFGPVVNLASRLEGITKAFGSEVILDPATAQAIRDAERDDMRVRRLATVRPAGLTSAVEIHELLPPHDPNLKSLTDPQLREYEASLDAMVSGDWDQAYERLHALPSWDRPKDALLATILRYNRIPPETWSGVIELPKM